ncbi:hypothetical protein GmRootV213_60160 (plasmid) [Variovorax sp. V213]
MKTDHTLKNVHPGSELTQLTKPQRMTLQSHHLAVLGRCMLIASMTKPITSAEAMQLVEQGRLSLDDPAAAVIPELSALKVLQGWDANGALNRCPEGRATASGLTVQHPRHD